MKKGWIFGIQPFSVDDGPGIRTTVFFKGCNGSCRWCHNPESIPFGQTLRWQEAKCVGCGRCARVCRQQVHSFLEGRHQWEPGRCRYCMECVKSCPTGALSAVAREAETGEILEQVCRDRRYYERTGGGMTLSGGEPTRQPEFAEALLSGAKEEGIHTVLETHGAADWEVYERLLPLVDLVLFDYKATGEENYRKLTGLSEKQVLENLRRLGRNGTKAVLRCPLIQGVNDTGEHLRAIAEYSRLPGILGYELMPYHDFGVQKAEQTGRSMKSFEKFSASALQELEEKLGGFGGKRWAHTE